MSARPGRPGTGRWAARWPACRYRTPRRGPGRVELDIDPAGLPGDLAEIAVHGVVVEGVDYRVAGPPAGIGDLPCDRVKRALGAAGEKTSAPSALNCRATAAPMDPPAPNTTACLSFRMGESFIASSSR